MGQTKVKAADIDLSSLTIALGNPVQSAAAGGYKKVTSIAYNPSTGDLLISYEE